MAKKTKKRKVKRKNFFQTTFGKKFTIADFILITVILGFPIYKIITGTFSQVIEDFFGYIWAGVLVAYIVSILIKRAKK